MTARVIWVTPTSSARDVALQLLTGTYSGVPVVNENHEVVGVVTEFDLLYAIQSGKNLRTTTAGELMSKPICVQEDDELDTVVAKMIGNGIVHVPVLSEDGKLAGVIARTDILSSIIEPEFVSDVGC
jgi:CBS domain-containing protein